ncbi:hypothetical protein PHMEG_00014630 [Phytophthora megakarya]|uniref:Integrase catalytic domain-containing protein n=1 Tax=Phytophthora megakarya TaxID=4795 RepID=A0A225W3B3_9STRA|nr:hypothetical protein PHMEG_00014630 [Phytophthora megakarya]
MLRTASGDEYRKVGMLCEKTGVTRQRSETDNQATNGNVERMQRTIMNMARSPTNPNLGETTPLKVLTKGAIARRDHGVWFAVDPRNKNFTHHVQQGMIVRVDEGTMLLDLPIHH